MTSQEAQDIIEKMINFSKYVCYGKVFADTLLKALLEKKSHGTGNRPSKATT